MKRHIFVPVLTFVACPSALADAMLELEQGDLGAGIAPGSSLVPIAHVRASGPLEVTTSHPECRAEATPERAQTSFTLRLGYQPNRRTLGSCAVAVQLAGQPATRRIMTVPLKPSPEANDVVEVRFTNPDCPARKYLGHFEPSPRIGETESFLPLRFVTDTAGVPLRNGQLRPTTKYGTYCLNEDVDRTLAPSGSAFQKLRQWLDEAGPGDHVFFSSYTFTNKRLRDLLCNASRRGAKVEFVLGTRSDDATYLTSQCNVHAVLAEDEDSRGRLSHAKFFLIERRGSDTVRLVFQSANLSNAGISIHQENWGFAVKKKSTRFAHDHLCYRDALLTSHFNLVSADAFTQQVNACRAEGASFGDDGIDTFLIPGTRGEETEGMVMTRALIDEIRAASQVDIAAHHFLNTMRYGSRTTDNDVLEALVQRMETTPDFKVRLILDAELYWVGMGPRPDASGTFAYDHYPAAARELAGNDDNAASFAGKEFAEVRRIFKLGGQVRYVETNFLDRKFQHNKFMILTRPDGTVRVFNGAGNFSSSAFHRNGENFYLIRDTRLTDSWRFEYDYLWNTIATAYEDMPLTWAAQVEGFQGWNAWRRAVETRKVSERLP